MDWKIELIAVPVTDVDRARDFWAGLGWHVDYDHTVSEEIRFVQITPPGSACSIAFGKGISTMEPGSLDAVQLVIPDADEALALLTERGVAAQRSGRARLGSVRELPRPRRKPLRPATTPGAARGLSAGRGLSCPGGRRSAADPR